MRTTDMDREATLDYLARLETATEAALAELKATKDVRGAINWGDLHCADSSWWLRSDGDSGYEVVIREAAPDAEALRVAVWEALERAGFQAVEVTTEW